MKNKTRKQYLLAVLAFLLFYAVLLILLVLSEKREGTVKMYITRM